MTKVLFVCVHNAGRSQMAAAFFNHLARVRGVPVTADLAGTSPGTAVNPAAVRAVAECGIDLTGVRPKLLTAEVAGAADRLVAMGCGVEASMCPAGVHFTEDWGLPDPAGQSDDAVRHIRDLVRDRVEGLLDEICGRPEDQP